MAQIANREIRLTSRPNGIPTAANFSLVRAELEPLRNQGVLVRNLYLSVVGGYFRAGKLKNKETVHDMTNTDLVLHREKLLALRAHLLGDMTKIEDDALKDHSKTTSIPTDMEELGSDNAEQEVTLDLLGSDKDTLDQIEAALQRIEDGGYGRCEECGEQLPKNRLDAIPYAAKCVRCASQHQEGHEAIAK